jgi:hypothetical protein
LVASPGYGSANTGKLMVYLSKPLGIDICRRWQNSQHLRLLDKMRRAGEELLVTNPLKTFIQRKRAAFTTPLNNIYPAEEYTT